MTKYLGKLVEQFKSATGDKEGNLSSSSFRSAFIDWLYERKSMGSEYLRFVDYMDVYPSIGDGALEVGKTKYDSVVVGTEVPILTPYTEGFKSDTQRIIRGNLTVNDSIPLITYERNGRTVRRHLVDPSIRFITQNPYNETCIEDWEQIHNEGGNITVGVFGSMHDKDVSTKLEQMKAFREKLERAYKEEFETSKDTYFYAVTTNPKVLSLSKYR